MLIGHLLVGRRIWTVLALAVGIGYWLGKRDQPDGRRLRAVRSPEDKSDPVDRSSRESFPASDPPSWTPGHA